MKLVHGPGLTLRAMPRLGALISTLLILLAPAGLLPAVARADVVSDNLSAYTGVNARGYLSPFKEAVGQSLNSGFYNSAHIPSTGFYFRLDVRGTLLDYQDEDRIFRAAAEDFFPGDQTVDAPTIVGATSGVTLVDPGTGAVYSLPGGLDVNRLALAVPQLTIGSVAGFEGIVRYLAVEIGESDLGDVSIVGGGLRYAVSSLFDSPVDIAAMGFYQKIEQGENFVESEALSYGLQVGKSFPMFDIYGGVGVDRYDMTVTYENEASGGDGTTVVELPAENDFHLALGGTFHLGFLHFNGEYNHAARSSFAFSAGIGTR